LKKTGTNLNRISEFQELISREVGSFCRALKARPARLYEPLSYVLSLEGKRVRPVLTLMACDLFDADVSRALQPALGLELFHNFSLIHDDIMDNAPLRRSKPTVHEKWSTAVALLSGDAMLVKAYQLMSSCANLQVLELFSEMALAVCEGQQLDMDFEKLKTVSIAEYLQMIELKTATLIAACLKTGALIAGARAEDAKRIFEFGKNIGIAFQLQDDILDTYGEEEKFGKQKGGDIIANKKTFLLLKALELSGLNAYKKEELELWMNATAANAREKVEAVTGIFDSLNIRDLAVAEMLKFYNKGIGYLNEIPASEEKMNNLKVLVGGLIKREK